MTIAELKQKIERHAPGSMIPRDWILEQLGDGFESVDGLELVDIHTAAEITRESEKTLRNAAPRWSRLPHPEIRVRKNDPDKPRSRWLFVEEDCWEYARKKGVAQPAVVPEAESEEEAELFERWAQTVTANL